MSEIKERLRREISIESYIGRFVTLKKVGRNTIGCCPFHKEKTPSFSVNSKEGFYHCFGCKASGDIFRFVMDYQKTDFPEAMKILSEYSGIPLTEKTEKEKEDESQKEKMISLLQRANSYFRENLLYDSAEPARGYLRERGITKQDIEQFNIGFSFPGFQNFLNDFIKTTEEKKLAIKLGLLKQTDKSTYDFFRNRIMFPIKNEKGQVIGFSGRIIDNSEEAKYINSPNSEVYDKGKSFYNLDLAIESIKNTREVVLVEGVLDVIGLYRKGIKPILAPLGTGFTEIHSRILKKYCDKVYLMFDSDIAGQKSAFRSIQYFEKENIQTKVCVIQKEKDPFDFAKERSKDQIRTFISKAQKSHSFVVQYLLGQNQTTDPRENLKLLFDFVKGVEKETDKELYLEEIAKKLNFRLESVVSDFYGKDKTPKKPEPIKEDPKKKQKKTEIPIELERKMVSMLIQNLNLFESNIDLSGLEFHDEISSFLYDYIYTKYLQNENITTAELLSKTEIPKEYLETIAGYFKNHSEREALNIFRKLFYHHRTYLVGISFETQIVTGGDETDLIFFSQEKEQILKKNEEVG
ncbi:DNA primase [Leptospira phage LE4]|uniref:DNA primase n=1 Tax=Leptospira phage LE4 TaxID=2041383 RepID=A0A343LEI0_9CAUD|nr:DNA primase [Leptospira phage LE4]ATN95090.1 DNA primase [Leptospira phage LE4]